MRAQKRKKRLRFTPRVLHELGTVYERPTEVVRELVQNAVDAGAKHIWIRIENVGGEKYLVFCHDGRPIKGRELDAFLTVGTDYKARQGKNVGFWGIGRLSWLMIGDKAVIETGDHRMVWDAENPMNIDIESLHPPFHGVRWRIRIKPSLYPDVTEEKIADFVSTHYIGKTPVIVNDSVISRNSKDLILLFKDKGNEVYLGRKGDGKIYKDGFLIGTVWDMPSLVAITRDPRVRINPSRKIIYDYRFTDWRKEVIQKALRAAARKLKQGDIPISVYLERINYLIDNNLPWSSSPERLRKWLDYYLFKVYGEDNKYVLGKDVFKRKKKFLFIPYYDTLDDTSFRRLREKGYTIIMAPSAFGERLKALGVRSVDDIDFTDSAILKTALRKESEELSYLLNDIAGILESVVKEGVYKEGNKRRSRPRKIEVPPIPSVIIEEQDLTNVGSVDIIVRRGSKHHVVHAKVVGHMRGSPVVFVESTSPAPAFTNGSRIFINVKHPLVKELLKASKRLDSRSKKLLWTPILMHEYLHVMGLDHNDPNWMPMYEQGVIKAIMDYFKK